MSKYLIVFIVSVSALFCINAIKSCETPDNRSGDCVELKDCPVLFKRFLQNYSDPYLKQCACGHSNSDVCCPLTRATESIATTPRPTTTTTRKTTTSTTPRPTTTTRKTTTSTTPRTIQRFNVLLPIPEPTDMSSIRYHRNFKLINSKKCGSNTGDRIFEGNKTSLFEYKWNVLLQFKSTLGDEQLKFLCGGTLIADQYVLSAAHCATNAEADGYELFSVRVGEWDLSTEVDCTAPDNKECAPAVQDIKVESYKVHEMYNDALSINDIMVIQLEHKVTYDRNVKTICLPTNENELITKTIELHKLIISGWGRTEHKKASDVLLYAEIPYLPLNGCKERMKEDGIELILYESHICAGGADLKDTCSGDSGGPLAGGIEKSSNKPPKTFQFGIVSVGVGCRGQGVSPGIYTNVAYYMNWILDQMDQ